MLHCSCVIFHRKPHTMKSDKIPLIPRSKSETKERTVVYGGL